MKSFHCSETPQHYCRASWQDGLLQFSVPYQGVADRRLPAAAFSLTRQQCAKLVACSRKCLAHDSQNYHVAHVPGLPGNPQNRQQLVITVCSGTPPEVTGRERFMVLLISHENGHVVADFRLRGAQYREFERLVTPLPSPPLPRKAPVFGL